MTNHQSLKSVSPIDIDRLKSFSDQIYAFSMTLLITTIHLSGISESDISSSLLDAIAREWRQLASYAISFLNIGSYWLLHHQIYMHIHRLDKPLLILNILLLLTITFIPLPTILLGNYGRNATTALIYGIAIAMNYIMLCLVVIYVFKHREIVRTDIALPEKQFVFLRLGLPLILLVLGATLSFVHTKLSFLLYFSVPIMNVIFLQFYAKRTHHLKSKEIGG